MSITTGQYQRGIVMKMLGDIDGIMGLSIVRIRYQLVEHVPILLFLGTVQSRSTYYRPVV